VPGSLTTSANNGAVQIVIGAPTSAVYAELNIPSPTSNQFFANETVSVSEADLLTNSWYSA